MSPLDLHAGHAPRGNGLTWCGMSVDNVCLTNQPDCPECKVTMAHASQPLHAGLFCQTCNVQGLGMSDFTARGAHAGHDIGAPEGHPLLSAFAPTPQSPQPSAPCVECGGGGTAFYGHESGNEETCRTCGGWGTVAASIPQPSSGASQIDGDTLLRYAGDLARAEKQYRLTHNMRGCEHPQTGRAWAIMRSAGAKLMDLIDGGLPEDDAQEYCPIHPGSRMPCEHRPSDPQPSSTGGGALDLALAACRAALEYDRALSACANDPKKMSSFCSAQGDNLDSLYFDWVNKSRAALKAATGSEHGQG